MFSTTNLYIDKIDDLDTSILSHQQIKAHKIAKRISLFLAICCYFIFVFIGLIPSMLNKGFGNLFLKIAIIISKIARYTYYNIIYFVAKLLIR